MVRLRLLIEPGHLGSTAGPLLCMALGFSTFSFPFPFHFPFPFPSAIQIEICNTTVDPKWPGSISNLRRTHYLCTKNMGGLLRYKFA